VDHTEPSCFEVGNRSAGLCRTSTFQSDDDVPAGRSYSVQPTSPSPSQPLCAVASAIASAVGPPVRAAAVAKTIMVLRNIRPPFRRAFLRRSAPPCAVLLRVILNLIDQAGNDLVGIASNGPVLSKIANFEWPSMRGLRRLRERDGRRLAF
jgi:hypothetical protein